MIFVLLITYLLDRQWNNMVRRSYVFISLLNKIHTFTNFALTFAREQFFKTYSPFLDFLSARSWRKKKKKIKLYPPYLGQINLHCITRLASHCTFVLQGALLCSVVFYTRKYNKSLTTKCDYLSNASVKNLESFRLTESKKYEKETDLSVLQQLIKQLQNRKFWKKIKLCEWKSFVTFEMPVKTIYYSSVNYEGS